MSKELKFKCPECGGTTLGRGESIMVVSPVKSIDKLGNKVWGKKQPKKIANSIENIYYHCFECGKLLADERTCVVVRDAEIVEWIERNCKQDD